MSIATECHYDISTPRSLFQFYKCLSWLDPTHPDTGVPPLRELECDSGAGLMSLCARLHAPRCVRPKFRSFVEYQDIMRGTTRADSCLRCKAFHWLEDLAVAAARYKYEVRLPPHSRTNKRMLPLACLKQKRCDPTGSTVKPEFETDAANATEEAAGELIHALLHHPKAYISSTLFPLQVPRRGLRHARICLPRRSVRRSRSGTSL